MLKKLTLLFSIIFVSSTLKAEVINQIIIEGNQRIEIETIKSYIDIAPGVNFNSEQLDSSIKKLFASNLFSRVNINVNSGKLIVSIVENPKINLVVFEGNSKVKTKDLEDEIELRPRGIFTKAKVQEDVNRIIDLYSKNGRFSIKVTPQIILLEQNRVNLIYKIEEGPVAKIAKIAFFGNEAFSESRLQSEMSSKETRWYYFLSSSDQFNPNRIEYDRDLLTKFYHSRGYADFKISSVVTNFSEKKDLFYITFTIDEGKKYKFGKIDIKSELKSNKVNINELKKLIVTKENKVFDSRKIERSIDQMIININDMGFAFVDIEPEIILDKEKAIADVTYHIGDGQRVYINQIKISENLRTSEKVIRREFRIAEGDPYNATKLKRTERRINDLNFFEETSIETSSTDSADKVDLKIAVQEKSTSSIILSGGYSTADGPIGKVNFSELNFLGNGQQLDIGVGKSRKNLDLGLSFTEPYMFDKRIAGGFDIFSRNSTSDQRHGKSFDEKSYGFTLRATYEIRENLYHNIHYDFNIKNLSNVPSNASVYIISQAGTRSTSLIGHGLFYDRRNSTLNPTEGYTLSANQEFAGVGGSTHFLRHTARAQYYYPVYNEDVIFTISGEVGHIQGLNNTGVNILNRFNIGGADSLRGFDFNGIGPRDPSDGSSLGGNTFYSGTAEIKYPLGFGKEIGLFGFTFVDAGSLYTIDVAQEKQINDSKKIRAAYGTGIGFKTPMGPIRLYYSPGVISKTSFDRTKRFDISFKTNF